MGRYMSASDGARAIIAVFEESSANYPLPSWARVMLVTGVGGGGGSTGNKSGGAGAWALNHPIPIPAGTSTISVVIGAPGSKGSSGVSAGYGGKTTISINGAEVLSLGGGSGAVVLPESGGSFPGVGGKPSVYGSPYDLSRPDVNGTNQAGSISYAGLAASPFQTLGPGLSAPGIGESGIPVAQASDYGAASIFGGINGGQGKGASGYNNGIVYLDGGKGYMCVKFLGGVG